MAASGDIWNGATGGNIWKGATGGDVCKEAACAREGSTSGIVGDKESVKEGMGQLG